MFRLTVQRAVVVLAATAAFPIAARAQNDGYATAAAGIRTFSLGAIKAKVLLDSAALKSGDMEMVELTFPASSNGAIHTHTRLEVIYVLEGEMDHIVNGTTHHLTPGMVGVVHAGDTVIHRVTSPTAVRALVMWVPGGELQRVERR